MKPEYDDPAQAPMPHMERMPADHEPGMYLDHLAQEVAQQRAEALHSQGVAPEERDIFLVGEPDFARWHGYYFQRLGALERISLGVYIRAGKSPQERDACIRKHAVRIAQYLYPDTVLTGASAVHLGVVDGTLHLARATERLPRPRSIGGVFTIYHSRIRLESGRGIPQDNVTLQDPGGLVRARVVKDMVLLLTEICQPQRKSVNSCPVTLSPSDREYVIRRYVEASGGIETALEKLERNALAMGLRYNREMVRDLVKLHLEERPVPQLPGENAYSVFWTGKHIAELSFDGRVWNSHNVGAFNLPLSVSGNVSGKEIPDFLGSLIPEQGARISERGPDLHKLRRGDRYVSNITVRSHQSPQYGKPVLIDRLGLRLAEVRDVHDSFLGALDFATTAPAGVLSPRGPAGMELNIGARMGLDLPPEYSGLPRSQRDVLEDIRALTLEKVGLPKLSGMQVKLPCSLQDDGVMTLALDAPFTHILKVPPPTMPELSAMEWFAMRLCKDAGLDTEEFAVTSLEGYEGPVFIAERFDIDDRTRFDNDPQGYPRYLLAEDFCSALNVESSQKYSGTFAEVADLLLQHSSSPNECGRGLLRQFMLCWLVGNSDFHLKNLSLLKEADPNLQHYTSVRLSPAYDITSCAVYVNQVPAVDGLTVMNSRVPYLQVLFQAAEHYLNIPREETAAMARECIDRVREASAYWSQPQNMPKAIQEHASSVAMISRASSSLIQQRCNGYEMELNALQQRQRRTPRMQGFR